MLSRPTASYRLANQSTNASGVRNYGHQDRKDWFDSTSEESYFRRLGHTYFAGLERKRSKSLRLMEKKNRNQKISITTAPASVSGEPERQYRKDVKLAI